jgi:glutamate N-acetyltransferase/amino-acid N-acetyltransferase
MKLPALGVESSGIFVQGFKAAGMPCGIKKDKKKDLALIYTETPAVVAGVFTKNKVKAAPVVIDIERIKEKKCNAVIINSGNANACTGKKGIKDAREMTSLAAKALGVKSDHVMVASTGVIGEPLPMDKIGRATSHLASGLSTSGWLEAAEAIMTTDTFPKVAMEEGRVGGRPVRVIGIAKGAGMIAPDMATMLAFVVTDAAIEKRTLQTLLRRAVNRSFNMITVDGDTSTNDMVLMLANGLAGNKRFKVQDSMFGIFQSMLDRLCLKLAHMIVKDGEGATKFLEIKVKGGRTEGDAVKAARAVANSLLVKTAFFGEDANWGRIMVALGSSGVDVDANRVNIYLGKLPIVRGGVATGRGKEAKRFMKERNIEVTIDLKMGDKGAVIWTTDLSCDYVKINATRK